MTGLNTALTLEKLTATGIERASRENARAFEAAAPIIRQQYGQDLSDEVVREIMDAHKELEACQKCGGQCQKGVNRYWLPVVSRDDFYQQVYVSYARCRFGQRKVLRGKYTQQQIPTQYAGKNFLDYEVTRDNDEAVAMARWFISEQPSASLYYWGACGTGKTFLASLIAMSFIRKDKSVIFGDVPFLMEELKRRFDSGNSQEVLDRYCDADLLVLDDVGAGQLSEWSVGVLYQIINRRYIDEKPCVLTSNYDMRELEKRLGAKDSLTATRIISRLAQMCKVASLGTRDRRRT